MAFTPRFFSEKLKIPVEYFNPFQVVSLAPHIDKEALAEVAHMFSEVIGLGLRHATECPIEISLIPPSLKQQQELKKKTPYFYASVASLIVCLAIFWAAVGFNKERSLTMVETATSVKNRTENNLSLVDEAQEAKDEAQSQYDDAVAMLKGREDWINLLNELQSLLPDNIWLTKIQRGSKPSAADLAPKKKKKTGGSLMSSMFSHGTRAVAKVASPDVEWLEIEGHTLILNKTISMEQTLKENFVKSKFFTDNKNEVAVPEIKLGRGINNLSEFKMVIKLKHPIKQK
jgi:Mor family transcriptional regulator